MALSAVGLQTHIWNNNAKSVLLLLGYPFLLLFMVWAFFAGLALTAPSYGTAPASPVIAGFEGVRDYWYHAVGFALLWFVIAWLFHQKMINMSTGARPLTRRENPKIYNMLENLCISRGITMPKLYMIDTPALNAYASGLTEKSYAITVTAGIVEALDDAELEAVLAHELSHIMNRDVRLLIVGVIFAGMISFFAEMLWRSLLYGSHRAYSGNRRSGGHIVIVAAVVLAIGYVFALLIRMAISRKREYLADAGAVELTKNPDAMVSALRKISGKAKLEDVPAEIQQMFIENPPSAFGLFDTHPSIAARIWALKEYAGASDMQRQAQKNPWIRAPRNGPWERR